METLPQLPEPYRWTCETCDGPIYYWEPALRSEDYNQDVPMFDALRPRLCPVCVYGLAKLAGPEQHERTRVRLTVAAMEGELLGLPDEATLLAFELQYPEGPVHVLGVGVDWWPLSLPHFVLDWETLGCAPKILVLRVFISIGWMRGPVWQVRWSWERPEAEPTYHLINGKTAPTPAEWDKLSMALRRFHSIADDARRPRDTTALTREQFRERVEAGRADLEELFNRPPYDTELVPYTGVSESTFKRYKRKGWLSEST
jgi:hypothetical protein